MRYTKELRQKIIDDFISRHGKYEPHAFVAEVRKVGEKHPAYAWFEWDDDEAALQHRLFQARQFVQGLRVSFEVQVTERAISGIQVREAPAYLSSMDTRHRGGGYYKVDTNNETHVAELLRQASVSFESWVRRYGDIYALMGGDPEAIEMIRSALTQVKRETEDLSQISMQH